MKRLKNAKQKNTKNREFSRRRLIEASTLSVDVLLLNYNSTTSGIINDDIIEQSQEKYGVNKISKSLKPSIFKQITTAFINPFSGILFLLAIISIIFDVILAPSGSKDYATSMIILTMITLSGILRFVQENRSGNAAEKLQEMVETTTCVERNGEKKEIPLDEIVVGDIIHLAAGDIIPGDVRIIWAKDMFISQASLTGESEPIEKLKDLNPNKKYDTLTDRENLAFMGSVVISGSAKAMVVVTGDSTLFGQIAAKLSEKPTKTRFDKDISAVSWILIRFMLIMVPIVFVVNGISKKDWIDAFLFAISIAVGLTPEMLPMIVTSCLANGALRMSKKKTIVKSINSIQNFGAIDILCTDKTGTLTQDRVILEYHLDVMGKENTRVLRHAFINSYFQTGLKNLLDKSIIDKTYELQTQYPELKNVDTQFEKVDEIPFDFNRKRMSVVVSNKAGKTQMITKGAIDEILSICTYVEYNGQVLPLSDELSDSVLETVHRLNEDGMRVIAVAQKTNPSPIGAFGVKDENDMVLIGYLAFYDPPKESAAATVKALDELGVHIKILTGDSARVTTNIANRIGLKNTTPIVGKDIELMSDETLKTVVETNNVFAKLSPDQKARVIRVLKENGHVVGYLGDGINDAPALKTADVGISVDTAVDIAKESAHIILLEKDLNVLKEGIIEGRKTYANMIKYIKMTASSNFGNMFSVLIASLFLPFLPMLPMHLLLLNLIYDLSCIAIPWDNVDQESIQAPQKWNANGLARFMMIIGPISSIFDILTYALLFFVIGPNVFNAQYHQLDAIGKINFMMLFQAGWFIESICTQTLVVHLIRTKKIPFIQSRASLLLTTTTLVSIIITSIIPFTAFGKELKFIAPPLYYFYFVALIIILYSILLTIVKKIYIKKYKVWL